MATPSSSSASTPADSAPRDASGPSSQEQKRDRRDLTLGNPKSQYFKVWYCCQCKDGPQNVSVVSSCPNCRNHHRCSSCPTQTLEKHD